MKEYRVGSRSVLYDEEVQDVPIVEEKIRSRESRKVKTCVDKDPKIR